MTCLHFQESGTTIITYEKGTYAHEGGNGGVVRRQVCRCLWKMNKRGRHVKCNPFLVFDLLGMLCNPCNIKGACTRGSGVLAFESQTAVIASKHPSKPIRSWCFSVGSDR